MGLFPYTFESEKPHHIKNIFVMGLDKRSLHNRSAARKSKELLRRQSGNTEEIIAYADKANERLRKRYYRLVNHNMKCANKANTAVARELACFVWGMMTGNTHTVMA